MMTSAADTPRSTTRRPPGISGWLNFAGILLLVVGLFNIVDGLVALFRSETFLVTSDKVLLFDFGAWGWILLIGGILLVLVGAGVITGRMWARVAGVVLAIIVALSHILFLPAFPIWSLIVVGLCVLVIYALTVPPGRPIAT
jgi:hypothetical protein